MNTELHDTHLGRALSDGMARVMGIKVCTNCQKSRPVEGFKTVRQANGRKRDLCGTCCDRIKPARAV